MPTAGNDDYREQDITRSWWKSMNFSIKIGSFNTELGGGIFPTSQENRMLFCSRKSQVRTLPGETAKSEAQEELPQEGCSHSGFTSG